MDNFDLDPTAVDATSLACGAIAIDSNDPDRIYLGTGEGDTNEIFASRLTNALPAYRGVGPVRSDDGGGSWHTEPTAAGSPTLLGAAFFALAVDPADRENVVGATNTGLYRREPNGAGGYQWVQKRAGIHSSVVVTASGGTTTFFAAAWGDRVYSSNDGSTWTAVGTGFPTGFGRIGLAVQSDNVNAVYALVALTLSSGNSCQGIYRLDNLGGQWHNISGAPSGLLGGQMGYDLAMTIDPNDVNTLYVGGQAVNVGDGAIFRCAITSAGSPPAYSMVATSIGTGSHADVHVLLHAPANSDVLWVCCDGGVFQTANATAGSPTFVARNTGLGTLSAEYIGQHPTEPAVLFVGLQDNGTARFTGEECWTGINGGDGGYCVVNWNNPFEVLTYADGGVYRATDGGQDYGSWADVTPPVGWQIMDEPLVGTPYNPANPADAETVAFGAGPSLFISSDFGATWPTSLTVATPIFAMIFASASRLYVGTTTGQVYRYDLSGSTWTPTRIDNAAGGALPLSGLITDLEVDPTDASGKSIYLSFGGHGDYRHLWHFDGNAWQSRSGTSGSVTALLDVEHNALVVDPSNPSTIFVGADIGVWKSQDGGLNWYAMESGLPDAAVLDLQIHQPARLLRAALHGRGVFEFKLDPPAEPDVQLYIRDTTLDLGLVPTVDGLSDPSQWPIQQVVHYESPNIKVDVPTPAGYQTPTKQIDFYIFNDKLVDGSGGVATIDPSKGTVVNRVYVEVHNRGIKVEPAVQVMLLLANASAGLQPLPAGYAANVQAGTPISSATWQTVGITTISNLRVGVPQIVEFGLPSTMLPPPASLPGQSHFCLLAILHSVDDAFTNTITNADDLTIADRKVGQKNLNIVQFVGTPPPPGIHPQWGMLDIYIDRQLHEAKIIFNLQHFPGRVGVVVPRELHDPELIKTYLPGNHDVVKDWVEKQRRDLRRLMKSGRFNFKWSEKMLRATETLKGEPLLALKPRAKGNALPIRLRAGSTHTMFLRIEPWSNAKSGEIHRFDVQVVDPRSGRVHGGTRYEVQVVKPH
jgi:hypothetical protein